MSIIHSNTHAINSAVHFSDIAYRITSPHPVSLDFVCSLVSCVSPDRLCQIAQINSTVTRSSHLLLLLFDLIDHSAHPFSGLISAVRVRFCNTHSLFSRSLSSRMQRSKAMSMLRAHFSCFHPYQTDPRAAQTIMQQRCQKK